MLLNFIFPLFFGAVGLAPALVSYLLFKQILTFIARSRILPSTTAPKNPVERHGSKWGSLEKIFIGVAEKK